MAIYANSTALYAVLRATFTRLAREAPNHLDGLHSLMAARIALQLVTTAPAAEITLNAKEKAFQAIYGTSQIKGDLVVNLSADTLHRILMDELSIKASWTTGQIKVKGPVWKLKVLTDLVKGAREFYPKVFTDYQAQASAKKARD